MFQKIVIFGEKTQKFLQNMFCGFCQKFNHFIYLFPVKTVHNSFLYDSAETDIWEKSGLIMV